MRWISRSCKQEQKLGDGKTAGHKNAKKTCNFFQVSIRFFFGLDAPKKNQDQSLAAPKKKKDQSLIF